MERPFSGCVITDHRLALPSFPTKAEEGRKAGLTPVLVERRRLLRDERKMLETRSHEANSKSRLSREALARETGLASGSSLPPRGGQGPWDGPQDTPGAGAGRGARTPDPGVWVPPVFEPAYVGSPQPSAPPFPYPVRLVGTRWTLPAHPPAGRSGPFLAPFPSDAPGPCPSPPCLQGTPLLPAEAGTCFPLPTCPFSLHSCFQTAGRQHVD